MNYNKKTVQDVDVRGKKVLLRCDFNVPQDKETGAITSSFSWAYSLLQLSLSGSKASARPPQPTYRERIFCCSGVACPVVSSKYFSSLIAVMLFYIANEGISIIENAAALGLPVPEKLKEIMEQIKTKGESEEK